MSDPILRVEDIQKYYGNKGSLTKSALPPWPPGWRWASSCPRAFPWRRSAFLPWTWRGSGRCSPPPRCGRRPSALR